MENKFLPIGSVCTLKGKNKKVMITGYYSVEFNGNLKIDDYQGCAYPEGLLLPEFVCNFNHSDIEKVDFVGYKNDDQNKFNALLNKLTSNDEDNVKNDEWSLASSQSYSKLLFDENGVVVLAEPLPTKEVKNNLKFDENGFVIEDGNSKVENPFYKEYTDENPVKNDSNSDIFNKYKFDENGILLSVEDNEKVENKLNKIEFDENGIVVSAGEQKSTPQYKFDENGILISVEEENLEETEELKEYKPEYEFDENGILVSVAGEKLNKEEEPKEQKPSYKFDENGTVVEA